MSSFRSASQPLSVASRSRELLLAVGAHAFVNVPQADTMNAQFVPINDNRGRMLDSNLLDGEEVEILAWRPRSTGGLAYQVRRLTDGCEWWVRSPYLRKLCIASPDAGPTSR